MRIGTISQRVVKNSILSPVAEAALPAVIPQMEQAIPRLFSLELTDILKGAGKPPAPRPSP